MGRLLIYQIKGGKGMKWEYRQVDVTENNLNNINLDSFGSAGWELVSVTKTSKGYRYTFKRPY
jgi:hypothetical protein